MGCSTSTPFKDYYMGAERKKGCNCQCHKVGASPLVPALGQFGGSGPREREAYKEDERIPLTGRQIFLIKRSWKGISRNMCATGINMFLSLFEQNKDVMKFFTGLQAGMTISELRESKLLENHVKGVMLTIDEAITNMDDADNTVDMLLYVGKSHTRFKDFDPSVFLLIKEPFLLAVSDTLGDRYTAHMKDIYAKAISFILTSLVSGFGVYPVPSGGPTAAIAADGKEIKRPVYKNGYGGGGYENAPKPGTSQAQ